MKTNQIRKITDASVIVGIYGVIILISRFLGGQLEYNLSFLMPLPIALYSYKYNVKHSLIPFVSSLIISFLFSANPISALVFIFPYLLIGIILGGILVKKDIKNVYGILIITVISAIVEVLTSLVFYKALGFENIFIDLQNIVLDLEKFLGQNNWDFALIQALLEGLIPSIIIVISLLSSITSYLMFIILCTRIFKVTLTKNSMDFFTLKNNIPPTLTGIYIICCITSLIVIPYFSNALGLVRIMYTVVLNITIIAGVFYWYYGIRVAALLIKLSKQRWLIIVEIILIFFATPVFVLLGILDNIFSLQEKIYIKMKSRL